jgi:methylated-DNA-[protein]-cysteine S-methyltransferase
MRNSEREMHSTAFHTPVGWMGVSVTGMGICKIVLPKKDKKAAEKELVSGKCAVKGKLSPPARIVVLKRTVKLLQKYFSGERVIFDLPLDTSSYTPFQRAVWRAAAEVPAGATRSYAWIAKKINKPLAARAVGQALGANPVPILVPCHRVISSSGSLGGYAGGLGMKRILLELEKKETRG